MKKLAGLWVSNFILFMAYTQPIVIADSVSIADTAILPGDYALGSRWLGMKMAVSPKRVGEIAVRNTLKKRHLLYPAV